MGLLRRQQLCFYVATAACLFLVATQLQCVSGQSFTVSSCSSTTQYFDTPDLTCGLCSPSNADVRVPDIDTLDSLGFAATCECPAGYIVADAACDINNPTTCGPPTCTSCLTSSMASSQDKSRCMACGASTLGLTIGSGVDDCTCADGSVLVESSITGVPLSTKECQVCPTDTHVFTSATSSFKASRYLCQSCPGAPERACVWVVCVLVGVVCGTPIFVSGH